MDRPETDPMRLAVVICSVGRAAILNAALPYLARQTRRPDRVLLVVTRPEDVGPDGRPDPTDLEVEVVIAPKGLPRQRNAGLDHLGDSVDIVVFYDDDFLPAPGALAAFAATFAAHPEVAGLTGTVIADGINGPGLGVAEGEAILQDWQARHPDPQPIALGERRLIGLYGCNMAYRRAAVGSLRFDENLPLYGWQEDVDFAARLPGEKRRATAAIGVHLGTKSGRETAGRRLGYSQVVNPWYLWRKGSLPRRLAWRLVFRNMAANHLRAWRPEPWIDRAGRARGNRLGLWHILTGRADPGHILKL